MDEHRLGEVARSVAGTDVPVLVLGRGSNLLVADRGFEGLVLRLGPGFESLVIEGTDVRAGAAVSLPVLARRTAAAGLTGLEWAVGVPGSVGGAVRMNAGGHGSDTVATLVDYGWVDLATGSGGTAPVAALLAGYRRTALTPAQVVTGGTFRLRTGDAADGAATIAEIVRWRRANQPGGSNAGSVFANPPGDSAGRLIDACGLKGVADRHCRGLLQARQFHPGRSRGFGRRRAGGHRTCAGGGGRGHRCAAAHRGPPGGLLRSRRGSP